MAKLLLNLRHVPDDEADEIRALLSEHRIEFYETEPSMWGVSGGGIWIRNREDAAKAERLMTDYQARRRERARADLRAAKLHGSAPTIWTLLRQNPMAAIGLLIVITFILVVLALPFALLSDW